AGSVAHLSIALSVSGLRRHGRPAWVFFFQAEDGIRDGHVTGVQTCALPIYVALAKGFYKRRGLDVTFLPGGLDSNPIKAVVSGRSEERRVGKECRSRRASGH